jgi:hypothetical protein
MVFSCYSALTSRQKEIYNFQLIQKDGEVTLRAENEKYAPITLSVGVSHSLDRWWGCYENFKRPWCSRFKVQKFNVKDSVNEPAAALRL